VPDFYMERALDAPLCAVDERLLKRRLAVCARAYQVRWRGCLLDVERQRILCHVEADDWPTARAAARCLGVEPGATWLSAIPLDATTNARTSSATQGDLVDVLAECRFDNSIDTQNFVRERNACDWCLDTLRVRPGPVTTSEDGRRLVAFFHAPDAESVRNAYRHATVSFDRVIALRPLNR
jgi:hypothetical protein